MEQDARQIPNNTTLETDVCLVGGGMVGLSMALEFVDAGFRVILLESGDHKFKHITQWLFDGESVGHPYPDLMFTRRRQYGGTSITWSGRCRPLDPVDFEVRQGVLHSGWPITKKDLDPYYERAHPLCELGPYNYSPEFWATPEKQPLNFDGAPFETKVFQYSPPTNFAEAYGSRIRKADNIQVLLNAHVLEVEPETNRAAIPAVHAATLQGNSFCVKARYFILAAGGMEITRILLSSNQAHDNRLGNQHALVGRYFMEHPHLWSGVFLQPQKQLPLDFYKVVQYGEGMKNLEMVGSIGPKEKVIRDQGLLNFSSYFVQRPWHKIQDVYVGKAGWAYQSISNVVRHKKPPDPKIVLKDLAVLLQEHENSLQHLRNQLAHRRSPTHWVGVRTQIEQLPDPSSRISLSDKRNRLGQPKLVLDWKLGDDNLQGLKKAHQLMETVFAQIGLPFRLFQHECDQAGWPLPLQIGKHHLGTTRMHTDSKQGVVDANCQVHGVSNLFIASGSVFPTSGQANPTLTILALSIRIADHIKRRLGSN